MRANRVSVKVKSETWDLKKPFVIARNTRTSTDVVSVSITDGTYTGYGECAPNSRYDEYAPKTLKEILSISSAIESGLDRECLQALLPANSARNAVDCAMWDLEAKQNRTSVSDLLQFPEPENITTVQTISIGTPEAMGQDAYNYRDYPILKIKLDRIDILPRLLAVHKNAPNAKILIDANESWDMQILEDTVKQSVGIPIVMIEQPLKARCDEQLKGFECSIPLGADESCHTAADVPYLSQFYDVVNIKLDKSGGLTEAVKLAATAKKHNVDVMVGCMLGTSLSMAPGLVLATQAKFVDLDAPILLKNDRSFGLEIINGAIEGLNRKLWGYGDYNNSTLKT